MHKNKFAQFVLIVRIPQAAHTQSSWPTGDEVTPFSWDHITGYRFDAVLY